MRVKYDHTFMKTPEGTALYAKWRNIGRCGRCEEWDIFNVFCEWSMANGYQIGMQLKRFDGRKRFGPDNCYFDKVNGNHQYGKISLEQRYRWNKTVNRIRAHYGLPLFEEEP